MFSWVRTQRRFFYSGDCRDKTRRAYFWLPEDEYVGSKPRRGTRESFIDRSIAFVHRMYQFEDGMSGTRRHASESFNVDGFCTYFWFCPEKIDAPLLGLVTVCTGLTLSLIHI